MPKTETAALETFAANRDAVPSRDVPLPSGAVATVRRGFGRDLFQARRMAGGDATRIDAALLAVLVKIDGEPIVPEALDDMPLEDVLKLYEEALGKSVSPARGTSSS